MIVSDLTHLFLADAGSIIDVSRIIGVKGGKWMSIEISTLKIVIEKEINDIREQLSGKMEPSIDAYEAIIRYETISSLVYGLYEEIEDVNLRNAVWTLKKEADIGVQQLMGF
jgi:hypothetical protein